VAKIPLLRQQQFNLHWLSHLFVSLVQFVSNLSLFVAKTAVYFLNFALFLEWL